MNKTLITALLIASFAGSAMAQSTTTPRADKREERQTQRIEQGKASGALNDKEAARLEAGQAKVDAKEAKAKEDGMVTKKEKAKLEAAQDRQSKRIATQKHDKQKADPVQPAQ